jgi:UDP-glucose:(heptosyl)LPS alpha-1,3-glucosyltransferase
MRIALVYRSFNLSGSLSRQTVELARHLIPRHEVHVFAIGARTDRRLAPACVFHDVPVRTLGDGVGFSARELLAYGVRAAGLVDREHFDVVHACIPSSWIGDVLHVPGVARGEAERRGISRARFVASSIRHPGNAARWMVERLALTNRGLRRVHAETPSVAVDLQHYYGIPESRILVVLPGVNLAAFRPPDDIGAARESLQIHDPNRTILLFCGSGFERKGLDRAIDALAAADLDAEMLVVGNCHEDDRFRAIARARGVDDRVRFLGRQTDTERYYQAADIFLLPTRWDVWGNTPIEAMACGIPSIVSSAAGSADVVRASGAGIVLSEPFSTRELREAIERLGNDRALRMSMGAKGHLAARAHSWESRGRVVEDDLLDIAERRRLETATG